MNLTRRQLLAFLTGTVGVLPLAAAQAAALRRVGVLAQDLQPGLMETFGNELQKLGYIEGANVSIELRNAEGRNDLLASLARELLGLKVEVIVAINTPAAQAACAAGPALQGVT